MIASTGSNDWTSILASIVSVFGTCFIGLITYIFHATRRDLQEDVKELKETVREQLGILNKQIDRNSKHIDSVMSSYWPILWRINGVEDFLEEEMKYRTPRIIGEAEARFKEGNKNEGT